MGRVVASALPVGESVLRSRGGRWSVRFTRRRLWLGGGLLVALIAVLVFSLLAGSYPVSVTDLVATLRGHAPSDRTRFFVLDRRLPRALVAMAVGAAFGAAGAVFQSVTRNPLASPDIIGISSGASAGAAFVLLILGGSMLQVSIGAFAGALVIAALILLLSGGEGLHGVRVVLIGVALAAFAGATVTYMLTQVFVSNAATAQVWLVGSLQGRGWSEFLFIATALLVLGPVLAAYARRLDALRLGDELTVALGVRAGASRRVLLLTATLLVAAAVATAGPITFVALSAPHIARRIGGGGALLPAALVGALLLSASDLIAQVLFAHPIPVGVVTVVLGGGFFLWLLVREGRTRAR